MKNLIAYYSFTNNNEKLAAHLQKQLQCETLKIETVKKRNGLSIMLDLLFKRKPRLKPHTLSLAEYEHIIFVAPVWAGKIASPLASFMIGERENIKSYSFITLCGGGNLNQAQNLKKELTSLVGRAPSNVQELWINDLLPAEKKNTVKYTSGFRIDANGFGSFEHKIQEFI